MTSIERQDLRELHARLQYDLDKLQTIMIGNGVAFLPTLTADPNSYLNLAKDALKIAIASLERQLNET